jgi:dUTP pyrophosphatase
VNDQQLTIFDTMLYTGVTPTKAYPDDAGFDLTVAEFYEVAPHAMGKIPLASTIKSADGFWGLIIGRSSTFARGLLINPGVIDTQYTGQLFAVCHNMTDHPVIVHAGERVVQWIPMANHPMLLQHTDRLPDTDRGSNGFGSSGR